MNKTATAVLLFLSIPAIALAQSGNTHNIQGSVFDTDINEPMPIAAVQLLSLPDSSMVKGVVTENNGTYEIQNVRNGKYVLKVTYVGYHDGKLPVELTSKSDKTVRVARIDLVPDRIMLAAAEIVAEVPKVQSVKDTIMFNSAAYRMSEGSSVQELIKKLPGVEMDADGNITVNGKAVSQILINGKEYLGEDITTLLENLPADMIDRLKTYEKKSDLARITGIDDGEEQVVFDLHTKEEMKGGLLNTYDLAYGSDYGKHDLYNGQIMVNRFTDNHQFTLYGNASNVVDQGIGNGGRQWGGNRGLNTYQNISASYAYTNEKIEVNANVGMNHNENEYGQRSNSENFYGSTSSFSNSKNANNNSSNGFHANMYIEWKPDSMTNIIIRPNFNTSASNNSSTSASATYNDDPYQYMDSPLDQMLDAGRNGYDSYRSIFVNRNTGQSRGESQNVNAGGSIQANRRLGNKGRNLTLRLQGNYSDNGSENWSYNTTTYYKNDSTDYRNRYTNTPSNNNSMSAQVIWSEPVFEKMFLQFSYRYNYSNNENDRQTYSFDNMGYGFMERPDNWQERLDTMLSKYSRYITSRHDIQVSFRINREKFRLNTGVRLQPYETRLKYRTQGILHTPTQREMNVNPTFDMRYMFSDNTDIRFRVNGSSSQPSMTNLLDITDNTNPLNITQGNPNLKPSFTTNSNIDFHTYNADTQNSFMAGARYRITRNNISNRVEYNPETGGRTTRPDNINGNWNTGGNIGGTLTLKDQRFTVNTFTGINYSEQVAFLYQNKVTTKMTTRNLIPSEHLGASFRDEKIELTLNGDISLNHARNDQRPSSNLDTWSFSYGASGNVTLPLNFRIAFDILNSSRRGYEDETFNTDELICNAELQKPFLKNKSAIISAQFFDIFGQRKNFNRNISATGRSNTEYDVINQYFMLHFVYKLNIFNGKLVTGEEEEQGNRRNQGGGRGGNGRQYQGNGRQNQGNMRR